MPLFQVDISRILFVYIVGLTLVFVSTNLIYKTLKKGKNKPYLMICGFFISFDISISLNMIYAPIFLTDIRNVLYRVNIFFLFFGLFFTLLFTFYLYKENKMKNQYLIIFSVLYSIFLILLLYHPENITISVSTNWNPIWKLNILISIILISLGCCFIPTIAVSIIIYRKFRLKILKKKFKYFIIGIIGAYMTLYGAIIAYSTNNSTIILIFSFTSIVNIVWALFIYYGMTSNL
ncbi:hypothetical protein LCGC14_1360300 [marine sediment metagenome]|uniref:Histidine kinase N-terminal 7TM region domain-containing protein n=1 Tax=marine sediment metagenome TaxID=412755 RepID=A0A0F9K8E6_9ZZZZ